MKGVGHGESASVSVDHYENFPVASWLCPPELRPPITAIYRFARTADDIADEGEQPAEVRVAELTAFRADLLAVAGGATPSPRWPDVFGPLAEAIARYGLPTALLADLLDAFSDDAMQTRYADRAGLLDYCRRSANPIGRLLLHLYGIDDAASLARSDAICSALQLANFWQDLGVDAGSGRIYVPAVDARRHGVTLDDLLGRRDSERIHGLVAELVAWTRALMLTGAPLAHAIPGRAGWELRFVVQSGLRILHKIDRLGGATLCTRPTVGATDVPLLAWRALTMRPLRAAAAAASAPRAERR
ncbi:MAG TPA: squalene synthase HpnC [Caldimonas sp.]|jgi:squalene synthase HpnC|nr:squalene synthase HpnC [Caldimonas sp.]HEX4235961.1 squalene synthase HpnC [Caldimonas sp.]